MLHNLVAIKFYGRVKIKGGKRDGEERLFLELSGYEPCSLSMDDTKMLYDYLKEHYENLEDDEFRIDQNDGQEDFSA